MTTELWTAVSVADRLREAAETLARLPLDHPGRRLSSSWPDVVRSFKDYRRPGLEGPTRVAPTARAIDRMDEALLEWLPLVKDDDVKILWGWMACIPAEGIARRLGISRSTLHRRRWAALKKLAVLLNIRRNPNRSDGVKDKKMEKIMNSVDTGGTDSL